MAGSARKSDTAGSDSDFALARYDVDGSLDRSFSGDGRQATDFVGTDDVGNAVAVQPDGKLVVAGSSEYDFALARYHADGTLDSTFGNAGKQTTGFGDDVDAGRAMAAERRQDRRRRVLARRLRGRSIQRRRLARQLILGGRQADDPLWRLGAGGGRPGGRQIVVAGSSYQGLATGDDFAVARYNADGSLDGSYSADGRQTTDFAANDDYGNAVAMQTAGKIVVGGTEREGFAVARYDAQGSLDSSFSVDGKQTTRFSGGRDVGTAVALQADATIVVAGFGPGDFALARYSADGSLDSSFSGDGRQTTDFGNEDRANTVAVQRDGKIVAAGFSGTLAGDFALARYDGDSPAPPPITDSPPAAMTPAPVMSPLATPPPAAIALSTSKLQVARATIDRRERVLDVLAPITTLASRRVRVELHAADHRYHFTAPATSREARIRFRQRIPAAQARLGTGILTMTYPGDADTRPQTVRLRAAPQRADLRLSRPAITDGRLRASGTVSLRARGVVRVQIEYVVDGETTTLQFSAPIDNGRWSLNEALSQTVRDAIARRTGTVHSYTLFTGYLAARMRGEMRSFQILGHR